MIMPSLLSWVGSYGFLVIGFSIFIVRLIHLVIVIEGQQRQSVAVLEITALEPRDEEHQSPRHKQQADEDGRGQDIQADLPRESLNVVMVTTLTELSGMSTAATTGVTRPPRQSPTAARL